MYYYKKKQMWIFTPQEKEAKPLKRIIEHGGVDKRFNIGDNLEKWNYLKGAKDIVRKAQKVK